MALARGSGWGCAGRQLLDPFASHSHPSGRAGTRKPLKDFQSFQRSPAIAQHMRSTEKKGTAAKAAATQCAPPSTPPTPPLSPSQAVPVHAPGPRVLPHRRPPRLPGGRGRGHRLPPPGLQGLVPARGPILTVTVPLLDHTALQPPPPLRTLVGRPAPRGPIPSAPEIYFLIATAVPEASPAPSHATAQATGLTCDSPESGE